jgi:hypothetical protein
MFRCRQQANALIDVSVPDCRLTGDCWPYAQGQQRSAYPLDLNGSETRFPGQPCCPDCPETSDQFDIRFPASHPFISILIACEAIQSCAPSTLFPPKDTRPFPIRERLCCYRCFKTRRVLSSVLREQEAPILRGNSGIVYCKLKILNYLQLRVLPEIQRSAWWSEAHLPVTVWNVRTTGSRSAPQLGTRPNASMRIVRSFSGFLLLAVVC